VTTHLWEDRAVRVTRIERLRGGSKKGVYRVRLAGGATAVEYVWSPSENYWPARVDPDPEPFGEASGPALFAAAVEELGRTGVPTPEVLWMDVGAGRAVVQDVPGGTLEALLARDPRAARPVLSALASALAAMGARRGTAIGKVAGGRFGVAPGSTCESLVYDRALRHLTEAADRVPPLAAARHALTDTLGELRAAVRPRDRLALVHGELGGDHVLVGPGGEALLIDVEGLMWFDVEWEHVFLRLRFGPDYPALAVPDLDADRLRLYALAQHLSLVAGPLRLLDGNFPDRAFMRGIADHHTRQALGFV
jgi:aminoglycoside phosphotransferase (APT) family kinase protein